MIGETIKAMDSLLNRLVNLTINAAGISLYGTSFEVYNRKFMFQPDENGKPELTTVKPEGDGELHISQFGRMASVKEVCRLVAELSRENDGHVLVGLNGNIKVVSPQRHRAPVDGKAQPVKTIVLKNPYPTIEGTHTALGLRSILQTLPKVEAGEVWDQVLGNLEVVASSSVKLKVSGPFTMVKAKEMNGVALGEKVTVKVPRHIVVEGPFLDPHYVVKQTYSVLIKKKDGQPIVDLSLHDSDAMKLTAAQWAMTELKGVKLGRHEWSYFMSTI